MQESKGSWNALRRSLGIALRRFPFPQTGQSGRLVRDKNRFYLRSRREFDDDHEREARNGRGSL